MLAHLLENDIRNWAETYLAALLEGAQGEACSTAYGLSSAVRRSGAWREFAEAGIACSAARPGVPCEMTRLRSVKVVEWIRRRLASN